MFRYSRDPSWRRFTGLRRPSRRTAPRMVELERRRLLSGQGTDKALVESVRPSAADREIHDPEAAKTSKQTRFVDGLYEKYLHEAPDPAELSYALQLLSSGVSQAAFKRDFTDIASKPSNKNSDQAFVSALYATIAGHAPTAEGQSYWQGLLSFGREPPASASDVPGVGRPSPASDDHLGHPGGHHLRHRAGPRPVGCHRQRARYVHLLDPAGTILNAGIQTLIVSFTPSDTTDYTTVTGSTTIGVLPATPTITWPNPGSIKQGTALSGAQLDATATCIVGGRTVIVPGTFTYSPEPGHVLPSAETRG